MKTIINNKLFTPCLENEFIFPILALLVAIFSCQLAEYFLQLNLTTLFITMGGFIVYSHLSGITRNNIFNYEKYDLYKNSELFIFSNACYVIAIIIFSSIIFK